MIGIQNFIWVAYWTLVIVMALLMAAAGAEWWLQRREERKKKADKILSDLHKQYGQQKFAQQWDPQDWHFFATVRNKPDKIPEDTGGS